ncbi:calcium-binding protein [Skermanella aerolata]|nr:calcium-binding protein [Skermanella aerolata]
MIFFKNMTEEISMGDQSKYQGECNPHDLGAAQFTIADVSLYIGDKGKDRYGGTDNMDIVFGRGGKDRLAGSDMDDDLVGGSGNDRLTGGGGMDHLDGGEGKDRLKGNAESDNLSGGKGADYLDEGTGHGDLDGGEGNDVLVGGPGGDAFLISPDSGHDMIKDFAAGPGILDHLAVRDIEPEELHFKDIKAGVLISWNEGESSVLLEDVFKKDLAQDDFMFVDDRKVIKQTSADADQITAMAFIKNEGDVADPPKFGQNETADETFNFDEFRVKIGGSDADTFLGTANRDYFIGLEGDDHLSGVGNDDDLWGGEGDDILDGGNGRDHLKGGEGDDTLYGGMMAESLMGAMGNDKLYAGAGHDMLDGGMGDDILDGGDGADAFIVGPDSGHDVVVGGFDAGPAAFDHIALRDLLPSHVAVEDATRSDGDGVLVSWNTDADPQADGSIFLVGLSKSQMAQDDFMFNADDGTQGLFEDDPEITASGSQYIFSDETIAASDYFFVT